MSWSEDSLHRWLLARPAAAQLEGARGHDAAVLSARGERPVLCVDQCAEGVHFTDRAKPRAVGAKAADRALSDLAATAATPRGLLVALRAPRTASERRLRALLEAVDARGREYGAPLVGGDLALAAGPLSLAVTALGGLPGRRKAPARSRARSGDTLLLTGAVGGSRLGRHLAITPRVKEGRWLWEQGATALMDVSDGLGWDLYRLARTAGVRAVLENVPVHSDALRAARASGRAPLDHALHDGEDHELLVGVPRRHLKPILAAARRRCRGLCVIGHFEEGNGLCLQLPDQEARDWSPDRGGWQHGR